jgi:putative ABC transport system permease protein
MYPELTAPLVVLFAGAAVLVLFLIAFRSVQRRLALRQVRRRPVEALLVVLGSMLGTALIVASLTVGDSLDRSVRQAAYDALGPIDVSVRTAAPDLGDEVARRLAALGRHPDVDGLLTVRVESAAAVVDAGGSRVAEPRTLVWEVDFAAAARFGAPDRSGLEVAEPGPGQVVVNQNLAAALGAGTGDRIDFYLYGRPVTATVSAVVPAQGVAGAGLGGTFNRNAFFPPGTLLRAATADAAPDTLTYVSNRGGVEDGAALTDEVAAEVRTLLGPLGAAGAWVQTPKRDVLEAAEETGAMLGAVFLFIASFSIIAGVLLIMNIFVMLTEERRGQLGTLRAIGMRRRRVSGTLAVEGAVYSVAAMVLGGALGIGLGRVVAAVAGTVFGSWYSDDNRLEIVFAVRPASVVNGMAAGFLIAFAAVVLTSIRISRANVIAAIRDLEPSSQRRTRRGLTIGSAVATAACGALAVPAVIAGDGVMTYLLPALTVVVAIPLLRRFFPAGPVYTGVAVALLGWGMSASLVRPDIFNDASTATYVVLGTMLTFGAVVLISRHQAALLWPVRRLVQRPTQNGLAARLAIAYPTAKRFRTGATLAMYCIVVLVIVMLTQMSALIDAGVSRSVADATGEWSLRADYNPSAPPERPTSAVTTGQFAGRVVEAVELVTAPAMGDDPKGRTADPLPVVVVGVPRRLADEPPALQLRLPDLATDTDAWRLVLRDPSYVLIDAAYGATGGPPGESIQPGQILTLTDLRTGQPAERTVAGVLANGLAFYGIGGGDFRYPVLMSQPAVRRTFGDQAMPASLLLRLAPQARPAEVAGALQAEFLHNGMVVTDVAQGVRDSFSATNRFFLLMQGYLGLGLLVGIAGLGVIMVRAVRERRRTIAVLRALGFPARTVRRAFVMESAFVAFEGVVVGTVLGIATTWVFYLNSTMFAGIKTTYPIAWAAIGVTVGTTLLVSLLATLAPARRAARIKPAAALRMAD